MSILNKEMIQMLRENKGWDQTALASAAGIHRSIISRIERGLQDDLRLSIAMAIAKALGVPVDALLGDKTVPEQKLSTELEALTLQLMHLPEEIQSQAAGILRGYLNTLH